ncbi:helix-turn-helix transcriptional regulator [Maritimibacter sp. HL-12]|jgi:ArsR family transcriptional regulator, arsenate/arsenite/antimonite-responsive transcriptional repressor|uniref:ArsR/SmtB family transcription factor n=1 Tax=Maritimibacter sp. HL-12 TaxID=1162418 RepID=UPI000A0EFFD4|nr:helix-turn-helix transcriptional regulator [Maritimibacter sp. HL-12]SMH41244.1 transcriptional regulator, ArsR family [Maritimibacter sp. HL-12]
MIQPPDESQALAALSALSESTRLRILRFLVARGPQGAPAGEIGEAIGFSSSRGSFHLGVLARAGLVTATKSSRQVIYRADTVAIGALMGYLINDCCGADPQIVACCSPAAACRPQGES